MSGPDRIGAALNAQALLEQCYADIGSPALESLSWEECGELSFAVGKALDATVQPKSFWYRHPVRLQDKELGIGRPYEVNLAWFERPGDGIPLVSIGGLTNVSQRFDFLAVDTSPGLRVIGLDLAGRGRSGWLAEMTDYHLDSYVEQLRQFIEAQGLVGTAVLGSSLGAAAAIRLAATTPELIGKLVLNDTGPFIPASRRKRRARAVGRHYTFRSPSEFFRRMGAATRYSGLAPDAVLLHNSYHKTRWSYEEQARTYRHDLRALLAYRREAVASMDLWDDWKRVDCPVLLIHGLLSDATSAETIARMRGQTELSVIEVPDTGHTPLLCDTELAKLIADWVKNQRTYDNNVTCKPAVSPRRILYASGS